MHIVQYFSGLIPPVGYGGIQRMVFWLAREMLAQGHRVTVFADGASNIKALLPAVNFIPVAANGEDYRKLIPEDADIIHFHGMPEPQLPPDIPYLFTEHGIQVKPGACWPNTVFLSKSHARSHGGGIYVYNGIPKDNYPFCVSKDNFMLFMARVGRRKKNAKTAINMAFDSGLQTRLAGSSWKQNHKVFGSWIFKSILHPGRISFLGDVDGEEKLALLQKAKILFYLVNWQEPFALAPHEAMACGTPVLASPNGALAEYIRDGENGFLVRTYEEALTALRRLKSMSAAEITEMAEACRASAFSIEASVDGYMALYKTLIETQYLYDPKEAKDLYFRWPESIIIRK